MDINDRYYTIHNAMITAKNMDYDTFCEVIHASKDLYSEQIWNLMKKDFSAFFLGSFYSKEDPEGIIFDFLRYAFPGYSKK